MPPVGYHGIWVVLQLCCTTVPVNDTLSTLPPAIKLWQVPEVAVLSYVIYSFVYIDILKCILWWKRKNSIVLSSVDEV